MTIFVTISISFFLGISCLLMPCCLGAIPGALSSVGWHTPGVDRNKLVRRVLLFAVGVVLPLTLVGIFFAVLGKLLMPLLPSVVTAFSVALVIVGLLHVTGKTFGFSIVPLSVAEELSHKGIFSRGIFYGLTATDCAATVFAPLIVYSFTQLNPVFAALNFLSFAIGRSAPFFIITMLPERMFAALQRAIARSASLFQYLTGAFIAGSGVLLFIFGKM